MNTKEKRKVYFTRSNGYFGIAEEKVNAPWKAGNKNKKKFTNKDYINGAHL